LYIKFQIVEKYIAFQETLFKIKEIFNNTKNSIHKARNELKIINIDHQEFIVKSFKIPHLLNQIVYSFFRGSKAKRSYEFSLKITNYTPYPLGYIEFYKYGLLQNSYFISEKFNYSYTMKEVLENKNITNNTQLFQDFANFTLELHNNNIYHFDYSPGNILIKENDQGYIFKIVDINRMGFFKLTVNDRARNFSKLWADENILILIGQEYIKHFNVPDLFIEKIIYYSQRDKKRKKFFNSLKGKS
jgi:serine/threonine protein kinase